MTSVTVDFNLLTNALTRILQAIENGNARGADVLGTITQVLGIIEIILFGAWILLGNESLGSGVKKFLALQFWLWLIRGFHELGKLFMKSLVEGALRTAGEAGSYKLLLDPSAIAARGLVVTKPLADQVAAMSDFDVANKLLMGWLQIMMVFGFLLMAVNLALAVVEFYLYLSLSALLIPFALSSHTRFLADKGINAVIACALKLAVLAFVLALIAPILGEVQLRPAAGTKLGIVWNDIFAMILLVLFCLGLCIRAPALAAGLIHGSPTFSGTGVMMWAAGHALAGAAAVGRGAISIGGEAAAGAGMLMVAGFHAMRGGRSNSGGDDMAAAARPAAMAGAERGDGGQGMLVGIAYYPASSALPAPSTPALAENYVDAVAEPSELPARSGARETSA